MAVLNDNIAGSLRFAGKVILKDLLDTSSVSGLRIERSTRHVRNHGVSTRLGALVGHSAPRVITRSGLREPYVTTVSAEVTRFKSSSNI